MIYNFDENEMPYGILERFGLTQEMIEDLPTDILQIFSMAGILQSYLYTSLLMMVKKLRQEHDSAL